MSLIENAIEEMIDRKVAERFDSLPQPKPAQLDAETQQQIFNYEVLSHKPYLNKKEAAAYLGCSERSIEEWSARQDNPFPVGYAGSDMRIKREKIDQWVEREAQRKRLKLAS